MGAVLPFDAGPKSQNGLSCGSTLCWVTVDERWAWSGGQAKHLVEDVLSGVQLRARERRSVTMNGILAQGCYTRNPARGLGGGNDASGRVTSCLSHDATLCYSLLRIRGSVRGGT